MPRARSLESSDEEPVKKVVRRAPRKRAVAAPLPDADMATPVMEEVYAEAPEEAPAPRVERAPVRRKAPRVVAPEPVALVSAKSRPRRTIVPYLVACTIFLISIGISAAIGFSDKGTIDVPNRIREQNTIQAEQSGGDPSRVIPVQNSAPPSVPNGGLVGQGVLNASPAPVAPAPEVPASTTASSTPVTSDTTTPSSETKPDTEGKPDNGGEASATPTS